MKNINFLSVILNVIGATLMLPVRLYRIVYEKWDLLLYKLGY